MKAHLPAAIVLILLVFPCLAQDDLRSIAVEGYQKADTSLNTSYKTLLAHIKNEKARNSLKAAQEAWIKFRDAEAEARAWITSDGGAALRLDRLGFLTNLTGQREEELKKLLKQL